VLFNQKWSKQWRCLSKAIVLLAAVSSPKHRSLPVVSPQNSLIVFASCEMPRDTCSSLMVILRCCPGMKRNSEARRDREINNPGKVRCGTSQYPRLGFLRTFLLLICSSFVLEKKLMLPSSELSTQASSASMKPLGHAFWAEMPGSLSSL